MPQRPLFLSVAAPLLLCPYPVPVVLSQQLQQQGGDLIFRGGPPDGFGDDAGNHPHVVRREYYEHHGGPPGAAAARRRPGPFDGVVPGLFATVLSSWLLWWNEGRYVREARLLRKAERAVVELPESKEGGGGAGAGVVDPTNYDGRLVHVTGRIGTEVGIVDPTYGLRRPDALRLVRNTESYQWTEERTESRTRVSDRETRVEVTYRYRPKWSGRFVDSYRFESPGGHENPDPRFDLGREVRTARDATLWPSGLAVPPPLVDQVGGSRPVGLVGGGNGGGAASASVDLVPRVDDGGAAMVVIAGGGDALYLPFHAPPEPLPTVASPGNGRDGGGGGGAASASAAAGPTAAKGGTTGRKIAVVRSAPHPTVGDVRVSWRETVPPRDGVSVLAEQRDGTLVPWRPDGGGGGGRGIYKLVTGRATAAEMIADLREGNRLLTRVLRAAGWVGNFVGLSLVLSCVSAIVSRVPLGIGRVLLEPLANVATSIAALGLSSGLSAAVCAAAWLRFRPLVAAGLGAASAFGFYGPILYARWRRRPEVTVIDAKLGADDESSGD